MSGQEKMDKRLYEYSDGEIYSLLEAKGRQLYNNEPRENANDVIDNPPYWSYHLTNKVFYFILTGGVEGLSEPPDLLCPLHKYSSFTVDLYDYAEKSEEMKAAEGPFDHKYVFPGMGDFWVKLDFRVWPHRKIYPSRDDRFKDLEWAKSFKQYSTTHSATLPANTIFDIIRYCDKISGLKAFW